MRRRQKIPASVRRDVITRDGYQCQYCRCTVYEVGGPRDQRLELDHFWPVCRGGENSVENLVVCCYRCNRDKGRRFRQTITYLDEEAFEFADAYLFIYSDPYVTSLYGEPVL